MSQVPSDKNEGRKRPRRRYRLPEAARVPRPAAGQPRPKDARRIDSEAALRARDLLREAAERIRRGDNSDLRYSHPAGFGTTVRGQAAEVEDGRFYRHWLPFNRFKWWEDKDNAVPIPGNVRDNASYVSKIQVPAKPVLAPDESVPADGATVRPADTDDALRLEFSSPFATVVGNLAGLGNKVPFVRQVPWDDPAFSSPNEVPDLEFVVRVSRPGSVPVLQSLQDLLLGNQLANLKVLINGVEGDFDPDPTQPRPPLRIDFAIPQRAVAFEFGFQNQDDSERKINPNHVILYALDRHGNPIADSSANDTFFDTISELGNNVVTNLIGVRRHEADIHSVELRFGEPSDIIPEPQIVLRIWHESLPPAAVHQGTLVVEAGRPYPRVPDPMDPSRNDPNVLQPPLLDPSIPRGPTTAKLPFRCNRAVVMLRGFRLQFLDETPREVHAVGARIGAPSQLRFGMPPAVFRTEPGGTIMLDGLPNLDTDEEGAFGSRALLYYTLLAWDSEQADLFTVEVADSQRLQQAGTFWVKLGVLPDFTLLDILNGRVVRRADPCLGHGPLQEGRALPSDCGDVFGGMNGFEFRWAPDQEVDELSLAVGQMSGTGCRFLPFANIRSAERGEIAPENIIAVPILRRRGRFLKWGLCSRFGGEWEEDYRYQQTVGGTLLTGPSLRVNPNAVNESAILAPSEVDQRPDGEFFKNPGLSTRLVGDVAFVGLGFFTFWPFGPVRELEVEVKGTDYAGESVAWAIGGGISTSPWISGGPGASGDGHLVTGLATTGAVVRKRAVATPRLTVQELRFTGWVGLLAPPSQVGAIRTGNRPLLITGVNWAAAPGPDEYTLFLTLGNEVLGLGDFAARLPVQLAAGEALLIGGLFEPLAEYTPRNPSTTSLDFQTNHPDTPTVRVPIIGVTEAQRPQAVPWPPGLMLTASVNGPAQTRSVSLRSTGSTPLRVDSLAIEDETQGFSACAIRSAAPSGGPANCEPLPLGRNRTYQINPGNQWIIRVSFLPIAVGPLRTRLVAQTNAGEQTWSLVGEGVP